MGEQFSKRGLALLLIDVQNDFVSWTSNAQRIIPRLRRVLDTCRANGVQVVHVIRHYSLDGSDVELPRVENFLKKPFVVKGTKGAEIVPELGPWKDEPVLVKKRWSAFFDTDLEELLRRRGIRTLAIGGLFTPNCIRSTVYDAISHDFHVLLLNDGTASEDPDVQDANILDMINIGVRVVSCEELIDAIDRTSKT